MGLCTGFGRVCLGKQGQPCPWGATNKRHPPTILSAAKMLCTSVAYVSVHECVDTDRYESKTIFIYAAPLIARKSISVGLNLGGLAVIQRVQEVFEPDLPRDTRAHASTQSRLGPGVQRRRPLSWTLCRSCRSICGMPQIRPLPPGCRKAQCERWLWGVLLRPRG